MKKFLGFCKKWFFFGGRRRRKSDTIMGVSFFLSFFLSFSLSFSLSLFLLEVTLYYLIVELWG